MPRPEFLKSLLLAISAAWLAGAASAQQANPVKACFIFVGPTADGGWSYQHLRGAEDMKIGLGSRVELEWKENVAEGDEAEVVMGQMAEDGCDIIFATSFGYMDAINAVAARYPDVKFEHATGYRRDHPNVSTYNARFYEGRAVEGLIAGRMTKTNKIGYIASFPIPEVISGINSYFLSARRANPDVELQIEWAFTWFDPEKETAAAQKLIADGVDVIASHTDSTAVLAEAAKTGGDVIGFGQASDMLDYAPSPRVSSIIDNWGPYYFRRVGELFNGTYQQEDAFEGVSSGVVLLGGITDAVPAEVRAEAKAMRRALAEGRMNAFTGPINAQDGSPWLAEGVEASDAEVLGMNFYVEGIVGDIPK